MEEVTNDLNYSIVGTKTNSIDEFDNSLRKRGRPKLKPFYLATETLIKNIASSLVKDLDEDQNDLKIRTDLIRTKLIRKAISIPSLILKATQWGNTIKDLKIDQADTFYREWFKEFVKVCQLYDINFDTDDEGIFIWFICLKFPESKIKLLINGEYSKIFKEIKNYLKNPTMKAVSFLNSPSEWKLFSILLKLEKYIIENKLTQKSLKIIDDLIRKFEYKIKAFKTINDSSANTRHEDISTILSEDLY